MKAWVTKYALSKGIVEVSGEEIDHPNNLVCLRYIEPSKYSGYDYYAYGNSWHKTKELAIARAEEMRIAKLKSLDKQIKKISALKFE